MNRPIDSGPKFRDKIAIQYPSIDRIEMPDNYRIIPIEYRVDEIEKYHVIFWHRLLKSIYDEPLKIECELHNISHEEKEDIKTTSFIKTREKNNWEVIEIDEMVASDIEAGKTKPFPVNWRHLVRLPSSGIVELGTKDKTTIFYIAQVIQPKSSEKNNSQEAKDLIDDLLKESNRVRGQLFNPIKEFEKQEGIRLYLLFNVYLSNYLSAETMLGIAESQEVALREEFLRYDARTTDLYDEEKRKHIDQHMLTCGMFYCSAITYFFMALEGFINLVFHAFLKQRFRDKTFRLDQRFDLEQKLRFMTALCTGFSDDSDFPSSILSKFMTLKNYRNSLFHSNIEESLKSLYFVDGGFFYTYNMDMVAHQDRFLPSHKINLTAEDVSEVKITVDEIVNSILESMSKDTRMVTETYILKEPDIPFVILETGELVLGKRELA